MTKEQKFFAAMAILAAGFFVNLATADAASAACVDNLYRKGSSGTCVRYIQRLNNVDAPTYTNKVNVDGAFGSLTDRAIRRYQSSWSLGSDGIVGSKTWNRLCTVNAGWTDEYGRRVMWVSSTWPLAEAKAAGCAKFWKGLVVTGVQY